MLVIFLRFVFLFISGIQDVCSFGPNPSLFDSFPSFNSFPSFRSFDTTNPCDWKKGLHNAPGFHRQCRRECVDAKEARSVTGMFSHNALQFNVLNEKCGNLSGGECTFPSEDYPIERFLSRNGGRSSPRRRFQIDLNPNIRLPWGQIFSDFIPILPVIPGTVADEEDDANIEGPALVTDVYIKGSKIQALIDTGSAVTMIHRHFVKRMEMEPVPPYSRLSGIDGTNYRIYGKTTVNVGIGNNLSIPITGLVTDTKNGLLIGVDSLMKYRAKINIPGRIMEISINGGKHFIDIKFQNTHTELMQLGSDSGVYNNLRIKAWVNGRYTRVLVDTGASYTVINKYFVNRASLRPNYTKFSAHGVSEFSSQGETNIELCVGDISFITKALVLPFDIGEVLITGNDFNRDCIEIIDFEQEIVTLKYPGTNNRVTTNAIV